MVSAHRKPGIWAMEGSWSTRVTDVRTITPVLTALASTGAARHAHLHINDRADLVEAMTRWGQVQHKSYGIGYVAMHGSPGSVHIGRRRIDLAELAEELPRGRLASKVLHFGSCSVLEQESDRRDLVDAFGVRAITGFTTDVDWFESLAFEILLFDLMASYQRMDAVERYIQKEHGDFARRLGFVMARRAQK